MTRSPQMQRYGKNGQYARVKINGQYIHLGRFDDPQAEPGAPGG
ncbi:MAG: hypothetical protein ACYC6N_21215 [Pirellulaceae bacterium]